MVKEKLLLAFNKDTTIILLQGSHTSETIDDDEVTRNHMPKPPEINICAVHSVRTETKQWHQTNVLEQH